VFVKPLSGSCPHYVLLKFYQAVTLMDEQLKQILETLPQKPTRSRLDPYGEFIEELRRLGRTYREIAAILAEKCELQVSSSAVHEFVQTRSRRKEKVRPQSSPDLTKSRKPASAQKVDTERAPTKAQVRDDELARRIAALKRERAVAKPTSERFQFDPSEPLRLKKLGQSGRDE